MVAAGIAFIEPPEELLRRYERTGDERAFEQVVLQHRALVHSICMRIMRNSYDAEDATQAVFLTLAMQVRGGTEIRSVAPWLGQVAHRVALDMYKSRKRRQNREDIRRQQTPDRFEADESTDLDQDELRQTLRTQLNELPAKYRMPMVLYYFGGMSPEQIAKELGTQRKTVGVRLFRARKMLAEQLASRGLAGASCGMIVFALREVVQQGLWSTPASGGYYAGASMSACAGQGLGFDHLYGTIYAMTRAFTRAAFSTKLRLSMVLMIAMGVTMAGYASLTRSINSVELRNLTPSTNNVIGEVFKSLPRMIGSSRVSDASQKQGAPGQAQPRVFDTYAQIAPWKAIPPVQTPWHVDPPVASAASPQQGVSPFESSITSTSVGSGRATEHQLPAPVAHGWNQSALSLMGNGGSTRRFAPVEPRMIASSSDLTGIAADESATGLADGTTLIAGTGPVDAGQIDNPLVGVLPDDAATLFPVDGSIAATGPVDGSGLASTGLVDGNDFGITTEHGGFNGIGDDRVALKPIITAPTITPEPGAGLLLMFGVALLTGRRRD